MADDSKNATIRSNVGLGTRTTKSAMTGAVVLDSTVEVAADASAASVYTFARIPTYARISNLSEISLDDLASTGSPTVDFGFKAVDGNITTDDDAINDGIDAATAAVGTKLIKDHANAGKMVWEILGLSADPGGLVDVTGTIKDAATNTGGTVTLTLVYSTNG